MSAQKSPRANLIRQIELLLGNQMVDVELDPEHYNLAIDMAMRKLRQRSDGSMVEKDIFIRLIPDVSEYTLPSEVQEVRRLYRRGVGGTTTGGAVFSPADSSFYNLYLLQPNKSGGLATWDAYNQFMETTERVFASQLNFVWDPNSHVLRLLRNVHAEEEVSVRVYTKKSEDDLINDPYTGPWLLNYALARSKYMLGEARDKFPSGFAGAAGSTTMNGATMKQEAQVEIDKLEKELIDLTTSGDGYGFVIG